MRTPPKYMAVMVGMAISAMSRQLTRQFLSANRDVVRPAVRCSPSRGASGSSAAAGA